MAANDWGLLDDREESELHKTRLLNVEEKPFKRITKRLLTPGSFTNPRPKQLSTPPPEASNGDAEKDNESAGGLSADEVTALKEDIQLDFAAFDSAIARIQFLATANSDERERYAASRLDILEKMEAARESNAALKEQLDAARATLSQRKKFDELADRITSNRMLRTRAEQEVNLAKLAEECEELQRESGTYGHTWIERRGQFERLVDEGLRLRAQIRDEKEEVERREGMDESDGEEGGGEGGKTPGGGGATANSGNATPRPDSGATSGGSKGDGGATPRPGSSRGEGGVTPRPDSPAAGLKPQPDDNNRSFSRDGSQVPSVSGGGSQQQQGGEGSVEEGEDVTMGESTSQRQQQSQFEATPGAESREPPHITVDASAAEDSEDKMDTT